MIEEARKCLAYLNRDLITEQNGSLEVIETSTKGAGRVTLFYEGPTIKIRPPKDGKNHLFKALGDLKCADGAFVTFHEDGVRLHIVELKGGVGPSSWPDILKQFEGMFLTAVAILRVLNVTKLTSVVCYLAATSNKMSATPASPILTKMIVGGNKTLGASEQWHSEQLLLPLSQNARLVKGWRSAITGDHDFGPVELG